MVKSFPPPPPYNSNCPVFEIKSVESITNEKFPPKIEAVIRP